MSWGMEVKAPRRMGKLWSSIDTRKEEEEYTAVVKGKWRWARPQPMPCSRVRLGGASDVIPRHIH